MHDFLPQPSFVLATLFVFFARIISWSSFWLKQFVF